MKRIFISVIIMLLLTTTTNAQTVKVGEKAPAITNVEWMNNKQPTDVKKPMFIDFFATWCGPCRKVMPHLEALAKEYGAKINFVVLSNEAAAKLHDFFGDSNSKPFFVGLDSKGSMFTAYGIKTIPHGVLIDKAGKIVWIGNSAGLTKELLDSVIKK